MLQLLISGLSNGCVYGLIAMGFVLIYKASEAINFAQGDMMMLGAFITLGLTNDQYIGLPFWTSVPMAMLLMGMIGYALDALVLRKMFGQSQIAVVIVTIIHLRKVISFLVFVEELSFVIHSKLNLHTYKVQIY